jgi:hypothetical protein
MKLLFPVVLLFCSHNAFAFPEMIRHGYAQCTACHVSPTGGGMLSAYGRELSAELLSTWSYTDEGQFLHSSFGAKMAEKGILFGGDVRSVQTYVKDPQQLDERLFLMQANIQSAYQSEHFVGVVSVGQINDPLGRTVKGDLDSTMYYGYVKLTDQIGFRAGRFVPAFGLNIPDHTTTIKQGLGFSPTLQFDTLEASVLTEHWTALASVAHTVDNTSPLENENVRTVSLNYFFLGGYRVGAGYWSGKGEQLDRHIVNLNGILGFSHHFYNLSEIDLSFERAQNGHYALTQFAYEIFQGMTPYVQYQEQRTNERDATTITRYYGLGAHFYPRPHFELSGEWDRVRFATEWADSANILAHYYF